MSRREESTVSFVPDPKMLRIAGERTGSITHAFLHRAMYAPLDFAALAHSCYMQGVNDTIDAMIHTGTFVPRVLVPPTPAQTAGDISFERGKA